MSAMTLTFTPKLTKVMIDPYQGHSSNSSGVKVLGDTVADRKTNGETDKQVDATKDLLAIGLI